MDNLHGRNTNIHTPVRGLNPQEPSAVFIATSYRQNCKLEAPAVVFDHAECVVGCGMRRGEWRVTLEMLDFKGKRIPLPMRDPGMHELMESHKGTNMESTDPLNGRTTALRVNGAFGTGAGVQRAYCPQMHQGTPPKALPLSFAAEQHAYTDRAGREAGKHSDVPSSGPLFPHRPKVVSILREIWRPSGLWSHARQRKEWIGPHE